MPVDKQQQTTKPQKPKKEPRVKQPRINNNVVNKLARNSRLGGV
jgi:hypothetical protein